MAIRTYGLSGSGMDVDQMVKDLMKARRTSYDKVWQQKTQVEWKKKDFNTLYTLTQDFRNKVVFDFRKQSSLQPKAVSSTNDLVVSATANGEAANVTHSLVVKRLAEGVILGSADSVTTGTSKDTLAKQFGIDPDVTPELEFSINGRKIKVNVSEASINDVVSKINSAGAGVKASYDATLDRFFLHADKTGDKSGIDFTGSSPEGLDFFANKLNLDADIVATPGKYKEGKNAIIELDGVEFEKDSNEFTVAGVSYNLKSVSPKDASDNYITTNITVKADIEKTIANVKAFVEDYNTFLSVYNSELREDKYRDFMPLTDTQRADLKDSEIAAWEAKAKSGMLRQDPILNQTVNALRMSFVEPVKGLPEPSNGLTYYRSAVDIGIGTGAYVDSDGKFNAADSKNPGKLYINETDLRRALEEDPDVVFKIFGTSGDTEQESGVANRLYSQLNTAMSRIKEESGLPDSVDTQSNLAKRLTSYSDRLTSMMNSLAATEERYYQQFNAMEAALSRLSSQSSWLMQQFSQQ